MGSLDPAGVASVALPAPGSWSLRQRLLGDRPSAWQVVAVGVAAVSWTTALAALVLWAADGETPQLLAYWLMDVLSAFVYGGATLLMLPRTRHPVALILAATAIGCGLSGLLTQYLGLTLVHPDLWHPAWLYAASNSVWVPGTYAAIAVLPWLVRPGGRGRWSRVVALAGTALVAWCVLARVTVRFVGLENPLAVLPRGYYDTVHALALWPDRLCVVLSVAGVARLLWLRARWDRERVRGHGWLALGQLFLAVAFVPVVFPVPAAFEAVATDFAGLSLMAPQPFLPGALLVVVLGQRLWGIDLAVDRAVVWLVLSAVVVTGYLLLTWLAQRLLTAPEHVTNLVTTALLLVASQPLLRLVQRQVDHLVYGPAHDLTALIDSLGDSARLSTGSGRTLDVLAQALASSLRLGGVRITDTAGRELAAAGSVDATGHEVALVVRGRELGRLAVATLPGQALDHRTRRLVEQLAGVVAISVELAVVNERLDAASTHLLEVRQEERRQLRRDLHDGMGPALAGVALGIDAARRKVERDPDGARALLDELKGELSHRTEEVRLIARSLLPPALEDGDLGSALAVLGRRFAPSGLEVAVDCRDLADLDTRRQVAVYHVAAEALLNVHRHASARHAWVTVRGGGDQPVVLTVADDGRGLTSDAPTGVGLQSMRERAEEQHGSLHVEPGPRGAGTSVRLTLP